MGEKSKPPIEVKQTQKGLQIWSVISSSNLTAGWGFIGETQLIIIPIISAHHKTLNASKITEIKDQ